MNNFIKINISEFWSIWSIVNRRMFLHCMLCLKKVNFDLPNLPFLDMIKTLKSV